MSETKTCPKCTATVGASVPFGLCPKCLVEAALTENEAPPVADESDVLPFEEIGRYRLLKKIGEGAFGEVFAAEQGEPVERQVAIKILKRGMDSAQVSARFEAERQALAMMNHPNVATVLDGGETDDGRPYFVMELVGGQNVTGYCEAKGLGLRARLEMFIAICEGVSHAHGRGIIHRDLKPANVLVEDDGAPVPKVIDFGIAKATERLLTTRTIYTELGRPMGTPAYMSPEQAESRGADVDVRTDVYSLGVLLYELLTGGPPFDDRRLREAGAAEMERILREEEPPRPSTRIGATDSATTLTRRAIGGDLDWIVMHSIEKERERRYASVADFARDLRRFLAGDAVEARPPSTTYRLGKWARKHRVALAASAAVFVALAAGTIVSTAQARRAVRAEQAAEERLVISEALNAFIEDDLIAASLEDGLIDLEKAIEVMAAAEEKIEGRLTRYPEAEAGARLVLARTLYGIGINIAEKSRLLALPAFAKCKTNARRAFELFGEHLAEPASDRRYIGSAQTLARVLLRMGDEEGARDAVESAFDVIGDRLDLGDRNQMELAKAGLEAGLALGEDDAVKAAHRRILGKMYGDEGAWEAVYQSHRTLCLNALAAGDLDTAKARLRDAVILARLLSWNGAWRYRGRTVNSDRTKMMKAGIPESETLRDWRERLATWNLAEVADGFELEPAARDVVHAFLLSEAGDGTGAAETLGRVIASGPASAASLGSLENSRAICLLQSGRAEAACAAAWRAVGLAVEGGARAELELSHYAATWSRIRRSANMELESKSVPLGEVLTNPSNGHRYALVRVPLAWEDAVAVCAANGGHLATSTDEAENEFLHANFGKRRICWLGASDAEVEGEWRWITGEPMTYTRWLGGQPNGPSKGADNEDHITMGHFDQRDRGVRWTWKTLGKWGDDPAHGLATEDMLQEPHKALLVCYAICEWDG